jgi:anhydro-N-acetylmuramic acid kinase
MSGTSLDGVDAALVDLCGERPQLRATYYLPYPQDLREQLLDLHAAGHDELHRTALLGNRLARLYADAVCGLLETGSIAAEEVVAIGCHGQTLRHQPSSGYTLQIGNPALVAELTGITTVADFRSRDVAAGGQGAPLVPAFHDSLFRDSSRRRVILNLGGIANLTVLAPGAATRGFDCGPANLLLDAWIGRHRADSYDAGGAWARSGSALPELLGRLLAHRFFKVAPPKSCGREDFSLSWLETHLTGSEDPADVQATLAALTAAGVADAISSWCGSVDELIVCGGGAHNRTLLEMLGERLPATRIESTAALGVSPDWVEAIAFAWLAQRVLKGLPGNLPEVTGARGPRLLGAIYPA